MSSTGLGLSLPHFGANRHGHRFHRRVGVAGIELSKRRLLALAGTIIVGVALLCSRIDYAGLFRSLLLLDPRGMLAALPQELSDFYLLGAQVSGTMAYLGLVLWLYRRPANQRRKLFIAVSMVANLAMLGFFKYCGFFVENLQHLLQSLGLGQLGGTALSIVLPPGISFYTFQAMSYTIDVITATPGRRRVSRTSPCSSASSRTLWPDRSCGRSPSCRRSFSPGESIATCGGAGRC